MSSVLLECRQKTSNERACLSKRAVSSIKHKFKQFVLLNALLTLLFIDRWCSEFGAALNVSCVY